MVCTHYCVENLVLNRSDSHFAINLYSVTHNDDVKIGFLDVLENIFIKNFFFLPFL